MQRAVAKDPDMRARFVSSKRKGESLRLNKYLKSYLNRKLPDRHKEIQRSMDYYKIRAMLNDSTINLYYNFIKSVVASLPYNVECESTLQKRVIEQTLDKCYKEVLDGLTSSIAYGFAFGQKRFKKDYVRWTESYVNEDGEQEVREVYTGNVDTIDYVKFIPPYQGGLSYLVDDDEREVKYVRQHIFKMGQPEGIKVMRENLVWMATNDEFDPIFGKSRFDAVESPYDISEILMGYLLNEVHRTSATTVVVRFPEGHSQVPTEEVDSNGNPITKPKPNFEIAQELKSAFVKGSVEAVILPSYTDEESGKEKAWQIELLNSEGATSLDITENIQNLITSLDYKKAMGLNIPPQLVMMTSGSGTVVDSELAMEIFMFIEQKFVEEIEKVIREDIIRDVLVLNFPEKEIVDYSFTIDKSVFNRRQILKEIVIQMTKGNMSLLQKGGPYMPTAIPNLEAALEHLSIKASNPSDVYYKAQSGEGEGEDEVDTELDKDLDNEKREDSRESEPASRTVKDGDKQTRVDGA